jgi:multicomponent Na+:H+ antiporter subunit D
MTELHPGLLLIAGASFFPILRGRMVNLYALGISLLSLLVVASLRDGIYLRISFLDQNIELLRVDKLSKAFAYVFCINLLAVELFAFSIRDRYCHGITAAYAGSSLGAVFAGDLISFYVFWELMAVSSAFLVLDGRTERARGAAFRYVMVHIFGGLCLLAGVLMRITATGSAALEPSANPAAWNWLMLVGILTNAAAPPLSAWLSDAYPESSVMGGVVLSAYTTKTAVYALARGFPGWEILVVVGCLMTIYGIVYALLENDMRRILAYSIINQVGFMVAGVGLGTPMSIDGSVAHAFCHIIYKSLLWMSAGAVLFRTGRRKCTELGGLYRYMPWTLLLCCVGAVSISSFPGTSGFTSKSLILEAALHENRFWVWLVLEIASAGVFLHAGIKFPYFVFFARESGLKPMEANKSMIMGMTVLAFLCIFLGLYPAPLYNLLPYEVIYEPYRYSHVVSQLQLLLFSALAFFVFLPLLKRTETISIDTDWFYRKGGRAFQKALDRTLSWGQQVSRSLVNGGLIPLVGHISREGLAWVAPIVLYPVWTVLGEDREETAEKVARVRRAVASGAVPIGLGAAAATLLLFVLFVVI